MNLSAVMNAVSYPPAVFTFPVCQEQYEKQELESGRAAIMGSGMSVPVTSFGGGAKYPGGLSRGNSTAINFHHHFKIMQEARDAMYDSVEARALVTSIVDTVVDVGLRWKPQPDIDILGLTMEQGEQWAELVGNMVHLWAQSKKSDRRRVNNFYQNQRLYQLFQQRDNDIFTRLYYGRDRDQINPVQIEFIDPNQINGYGSTSSLWNSARDDGIIRDGNGRETGFKVWTVSQDGKYSESTIPAVGEKSGRTMMLHGFNPEYAGQGRGYSKMAHLIQELSDLTDLKFSELQKAINQASFMAAIENEMQAPSNPLEGRKVGPPISYAEQQASYADQSDDTLTGTPAINWDLQPEATIRQPGSTLVANLKRGDKWINLQSTAPSAQFEKFYNFVCEYIAASLGWSNEVVLKKFQNNYSASRGTLLLIWRTAQIERNEMVADFLDPILEMVLSEYIAAGKISAPGWSDPVLRAAWMSGTWQGQPIPNIDPLKAAEADRAYVELGAQTLDDVAREYNGSSGKANRAANTRQFAELPPSPFAKAAALAAAPQDENNNNGGGNGES